MLRTIALVCCLLAALPAALVAENRALLVGIGQYGNGTGWHPIHGDADVRLLRPMLAKRGFTDITTLENAAATKRAIVQALRALAERCRPGDKVYFHFSGHGQPVEDANGDEDKPFDESIVPYDACRTPSAGYAGQNHLVDDELNPLLDAVKRKIGAGGQLFVAVDACYSKGMERGETVGEDGAELLLSLRGDNHPFVLSPEVSAAVRSAATSAADSLLALTGAEAYCLTDTASTISLEELAARGTPAAFTPPARATYLKRIPKPKAFTRGATMTVVSACRSDERNYEYRAAGTGKTYGSLSYCIYTLLRDGADFTRWAKRIADRDYARPGLFRRQHPTVTVYD